MSVTIGGIGDGLGFKTLLKNISSETKEFCVSAELFFADQWHPFPLDHYYGGGVTWTLPAKACFNGNLGIKGILSSLSVALLGSGAWLKVVVKSVEGNELSRGYWRWDLGRMEWIMEPDYSRAPSG